MSTSRSDRPARLFVLLVLGLIALPLLGGCSTFERDWKTLAEAPPSTDPPPTGVEGYWEGTWLSNKNGHNGALRCIVERDDQGVLQSRYRATFAGFLTFEYAMPMEVARDGETYLFSAEHDLGWLAGGVYQYEGTVIADSFTSTYTSKEDLGVFEMTRVHPGGG